ncbi:MAG: DUF1311 domain-containing protein, partial [Neisseriaceae bacterium]|nr:DUF1311 domain-containing protein [Neisseriaceae bacterium]
LSQKSVKSQNKDIVFHLPSETKVVKKYEKIFNECFDNMQNSDGFYRQLSMSDITGTCSSEVIELVEKELIAISNKIVQKNLMSQQEIDKSQNSWRKYRDDYCSAEMFMYQDKTFCQMRLTVDRLSEFARISEYTQ